MRWKTLTEAVEANECILILGPNIASIEKDGKLIPLNQLLTEYLLEELKKLNPSVKLIDGYDFSFVARNLEDFYKSSNLSETRARIRIGELMKEFYETYTIEDLPIYQEIAKLPFQFIINTNPDDYLIQAFEEEKNKFDNIFEFYHFRVSEHNSEVIINSDEISVNVPLVYNLFGAVEAPQSLVLTESDKLSFLEAILQREGNGNIPSSITIHMKSNEGYIQKNFVFLGFDFNQWHLKIILHLINRIEEEHSTFALQNPESIPALTSFFYTKNFKVEFVDLEPEKFIEEFQTLWNQKEEEKKVPTLKLFILYAEEDEADKIKLDKHLSVLKSSEEFRIQTWDKSQIQPGQDVEKEIQSNLESADIILPIVSSSFFSSDDLYDVQLKQALARKDRGEAYVISILMKSCLWQQSLISQGSSILPRNRKAINEQENEALVISQVVRQLEDRCKRILKKKKKNLKQPA